MTMRGAENRLRPVLSNCGVRLRLAKMAASRPIRGYVLIAYETSKGILHGTEKT